MNRKNATKHGRGRPAALALLTLGAGLTLGLPGAPARAQALPTPAGAVRRPGHVPGLVKTATLTGRLPGGQTIPLALSLPLRRPDDLSDLLTHLYQPGDPQYGHYLTPAQFTAQFAPTQADYDAARAFATAHGLTVTGTHPNRLLLDVSGPASAVEAAFGVRLLSYAGRDGRAFFAPDQEPALPSALAARGLGVIGLDNASLPHPANVPRPAALPDAPSDLPGVSPALTPSIGTGIDGLSPSDVRTAYNLNPVGLSGAGQTLALFELDTYTLSDVTAYEDHYSLPHVTLNNVAIDGGVSSPGNGAGEVTLDIELQIALAGGISAVDVYIAPGTYWSDITDCYNRIATDDAAEQISTSWGGVESGTPSDVRTTENGIFAQMASQGQSLYVATGDTTAYDDNSGNLNVQDPASQPYVTGVGGTTLSINGDGSYASETTWWKPGEHYQNPGGPYLTQGVGGGGGISQVWSIPGYQSGFVSGASLGSTTNRNVPDVSLNADGDTGYSIYFGGGWTGFGGTSCAAPLWAGFTALVNQMRVNNGLPTLGLPNYTLYPLAAGPDYHLAFHDIADGSKNAYYPAVSGYDDATGLGTFNGANLFSFLTGLYAEEGWGGPQFGTLLDPYATISGAVNNAPSTPVNLYIEGGSYGENVTISKPVTLINYGNGLVTIGT